MQEFYDLVDEVSGFIWGGPMILLLLGTGLYFMIGMRLRPLRRLFPAFGELWAGRKSTGEGAITPWQALSTALSGQVGTGNLAGVATAITLGGPGAVFWMWITALVGMAAAYAESSLAVRYRERHENGSFHGGPMYYIRNGLGKRWTWLAVLFAVGTLFSALATGNMIQSNSITQAMTEATTPFSHNLPCQLTVGRAPFETEAGNVIVGTAPGCEVVEAEATGENITFNGRGQTFEAPPESSQLVLANWIPGLIIALAVFVVIIGGIKSIGSVAGKVVPFMAVIYILTALTVLALNVEALPAALGMIVTDAFTGTAATGGFIGSSIMIAMRFGVERGLFSNEAGQGSTAIAHAASQTNSPVRQGEIAMVGTFIDTLVICTMTALVILVVQGAYPNGGEVVPFAWQSQLEASEVTTAVFRESHIPFGGILIAGSLALFAFTTILGWSYYAEQALTFLVGDWATRPFRFVWVIMVFFGSLQQVDFIWKLGGIANAAMAAPNLIALLLLSGVVFAYTKKADEEGQGSNPSIFKDESGKSAE